MRQSSIVSSSCSSSSPGRGGGSSMPDWRVIIAAEIPGFAAIITVRERRRQPGASDVSWVARPFVPEEDARSGKIERSYYCEPSDLVIGNLDADDIIGLVRF